MLYGTSVEAHHGSGIGGVVNKIKIRIKLDFFFNHIYTNKGVVSVASLSCGMTAGNDNHYLKYHYKTYLGIVFLLPGDVSFCAPFGVLFTAYVI